MISLIYILNSGEMKFEYYEDDDINFADSRARELTEISSYILLTEKKGYTIYEYSRN